MKLCVVNFLFTRHSFAFSLSLLGTSHEHTLNSVFRGPEKLLVSSPGGLVDALENGECNVISSDTISMPLVRDSYAGDFKVGTKFFSKDPLAIATRDGDPEWSTIVDMIMNVLYTAEVLNITQDNVASQNLTELLRGDLVRDDGFVSLFVDVISVVGNYGEIFHRTLTEPYNLTRNNRNMLNTGGPQFAPINVV